MAFARLREWRRKRKHKQSYRATVRQYFTDGGDTGFRFDYPLTPASIVLDLGGYEGQWASDLYARRRCRIHVFEPVERFARAIEQRFSFNPDIDVHAFALGANSRTDRIHIRGASSSLYKERADSEEIRFVDVAEWLEDAGIGTIDLMKINIEGGEYELLERMLEMNLLKRVRDLQVQFHNFTPDAEARMEDIQGALRQSHELTYSYRFVWENWRRLGG